MSKKLFLPTFKTNRKIASFEYPGGKSKIDIFLASKKALDS